MDGPYRIQNRRVTLGLLIDWCKDPYQNAVFAAIARACVECDVNLLCATGGNLDPNDLFWSQRNILYEFIGPHNVDGLIVMGETSARLSARFVCSNTCNGIDHSVPSALLTSLTELPVS